MNIMDNYDKDRIFFEFQQDRLQPKPASLQSWVAKYPELEEDLLDWAAELPMLRYLETLPDDPIAEEQSARIGHRVADEILAKLFAAENANLADTEAAAERIRSLTDKKSGITTKFLAEKLGVAPSIISQLNDRAFRFESLPNTLLQELSRLLQKPLDSIQAYLQQQPGLSSAAAYKSDKAPEVRPQTDFHTELRRSENMTEEQKARWLNAE